MLGLMQCADFSQLLSNVEIATKMKDNTLCANVTLSCDCYVVDLYFMHQASVISVAHSV